MGRRLKKPLVRYLAKVSKGVSLPHYVVFVFWNDDADEAKQMAVDYIERHKYDDCPAGFPHLQLWRVVSETDTPDEDSYSHLLDVYPNASDCAYVETALLSAAEMSRLDYRMVCHARD